MEKNELHLPECIEIHWDNPNKSTQAAIDEIAETKEKMELELQKSQILLDTSDEVKVKVNSDYFNN